MQTASQLQRLVKREGDWEGTVSNLAATLDDSDATASKRAPHLGSWLRQHEPTLWWDYGVHVRFSRTGRQRLVRLQCREIANAAMTEGLAKLPSPEITDGA
jgi:hypothetical protein